MFWDDPEGAEAILQIRAAAISNDGRLDNYLTRRPGWQFQRRTTEPQLAAQAELGLELEAEAEFRTNRY